MSTYRCIWPQLFLLTCFAFLTLATSQGCGAPTKCEPSATEACKCTDGTSSTRTCNTDGTDFGPCDCTAQQEPTTEPTSDTTPDATTDATPDVTPEPTPDTPPEPTADTLPEPTADEPAQPDEPQTPDEPAQTDDAGTQDTPQETTPETCGANSVMYLGKCTTAQDYCTQRFSAEEQKQMFSPFTIIRADAGLVFCQTKANGYYLPGNGYGTCDADGDGWITIESYRAVTHNDPKVKANARCQLKEIQAIVYHADVPNATPQIQLLPTKVPLLETFRNDGQAKTIEQPIYTESQTPLPKGKGSDCQDDTGCTNKLCYNGHCVAGRRFAPAEINTLTKACIAGLDLNDNQLDDASESPTDTPTPKVEFSPLLKVGYFMELQYGYYEAAYDNKGQKIPVFHIKERSRRGTGDQKLQLNCGEKTTGKTPDYWRSCSLRDDQRCIDPKTMATRKGLSGCWMPNIRVATRSLFKCVTFDTTGNNGHFAPTKYGYSQHYTRSKCKATATISSTGTGKPDVEFTCDKDDGQQAPKAGQNEVGWACVSHKDYALVGDYLAGCIQECTEAKKNAGGVEPCGPNDVCTQNKDSYGQGVFGCFSGKNGVCSDGTTLCDWGKYKTCTSNNQPSTETCNNKDDDCDGRVDDLPANVACWTGSASTRGKGLCQDGVLVCNGGTQSCANQTKPASEICDGNDNDCDATKDDGCPQQIRLTRTAGKWTRLSLIGGPNTAPAGNETVSTVFTHCPTGEALTGIEVFSSSSSSLGITQITSLCGPLQLQTKRSTTPYQYSIENSAYKLSKILGKPQKYGTNYGISSLKCPPNMVVVGIEGTALASGYPVRRFQLYCAPLVIKGTLPNTHKVEYGAKVKTGETGWYTGNLPTKFGPFYCPQGEAGVEFWANQTSSAGRAGYPYYRAFSVTCRPIALDKIP